MLPIVETPAASTSTSPAIVARIDPVVASATIAIVTLLLPIVETPPSVTSTSPAIVARIDPVKASLIVEIEIFVKSEPSPLKDPVNSLVPKTPTLVAKVETPPASTLTSPVIVARIDPVVAL